MNVENIRKVRDAIAAEPERFAIDQPDARVLASGGCGCISAWGYHTLGHADFFALACDLNHDGQYSRLIMPEGWLEAELYPARRAVAVLDHLIDTGKVDWSVADSVPA